MNGWPCAVKKKQAILLSCKSALNTQAHFSEYVCSDDDYHNTLERLGFIMKWLLKTGGLDLQHNRVGFVARVVKESSIL